jgi:uncharacterized membrane protein (DUF373 family)
MDKSLHFFEKVIMYLLIIIGMLFVVYETAFLVNEFWFILADSYRKGNFVDGNGRKLGVLFFNVLLTMEIVETVKVFNQNHINKIQIVLLVGLIAVTRKILLLDAMHAEPIMEIAVSVLLVSLGACYYLVTRSINKGKHAEK